jgi:hypothetical protein
MFFEVGCKWTVEYFLTGCAGGLVAVLILPGSYTTIPRLWRIRGETRLVWGALARVVVAGIGGCVVDCSNRNAFFAGFFAWHVFTWCGTEGWAALRDKLRKLWKNID